MLDNLNLSKVLFIDIETVPIVRDYQELDEEWKQLWERKMHYRISEENSPESLYEKAGIFAEFGKVVCVSLGVLGTQKNKREFRLKSIYDDDERKLLSKLGEILDQFSQSSEALLCAHNGKEFDFPYLSRRFLINELKLPSLLNIAGRKPWEVQHLDTMQLWRFGDYKHYTSLQLLCKLFKIDSPKINMDGSQVSEVYYKDGDLKTISKYCQSDVLAVAQLLLRYMGKEKIKNKEIKVVEEN